MLREITAKMTRKAQLVVLSWEQGHMHSDISISSPKYLLKKEEKALKLRIRSQINHLESHLHLE